MILHHLHNILCHTFLAEYKCSKYSFPNWNLYWRCINWDHSLPSLRTMQFSLACKPFWSSTFNPVFFIHDLVLYHIEWSWQQLHSQNGSTRILFGHFFWRLIGPWCHQVYVLSCCTVVQNIFLWRSIDPTPSSCSIFPLSLLSDSTMFLIVLEAVH